MAARLTSTGITFSDNTLLGSKYGIVPQNSVSVFLQSDAPIGWTKSTTHNDKTLRVVSGTGGGSGGSSSFTSAFPNSLKTISASNIPVSGSVGNSTLIISQLPSHGHVNGGSMGLSPGGGDVGAGGGWSRNFPGWAGNGGGGAHNHPWSGSFNFSTSLDFRVQYVDVIICSFA
jgi:hypothetical protein